MNINYPAWWDKTITLYNKYIDPSTKVVSWFKHTIPNCFWKDVSTYMSNSNAVMLTDSIVCRIPSQQNYLSCGEWVKLSESDKASKITIQLGDIIVLGDVDDMINEYISGMRSNDLLNKYKANKECLVIRQKTINDNVHTNNEHYHIIGD